MADGMVDGPMVDENGNRLMGIGPLVTVIPKHFHRYLSKETFKSYLACYQAYGNKLLQNSSPADIPVIVREYRDTIFPEILSKLNDLGKRAVSELHPWIVCTLIDVDEFDKFIAEDVEGSISHQVESGSEYNTRLTRKVVKPQSENTNTLNPCNTEVMPLKGLHDVYTTCFIKVNWVHKEIGCKFTNSDQQVIRYFLENLEVFLVHF